MRTRTIQFAVYSDTKQVLTPRAPPRGRSRSVQPSPPPRQPPAKPIRTVQAAIRLVGGRRPSMLQRWGGWGEPQTVSGSAQGATGTVTENTTEDERVSGTTDNVGQGTVKKRAQIIL